MGSAASEGFQDLVKELNALEAFFPLLGTASEREALEEEIAELEELVISAGLPEDEHSRRALQFLEDELSRKRGMLLGL